MNSRVLRHLACISAFVAAFATAGCSPQFITVLRSHDLVLVEEDGEKPIEGVAVAVVWYLSEIGGGTTVGGCQCFRSDANGRIHIPKRIIPGFFRFTQVPTSERIFAFRPGGWESDAPVERLLGWGDEAQFPLQTNEKGELRLTFREISDTDRMRRIAETSRQNPLVSTASRNRCDLEEFYKGIDSELATIAR